MNEIAPTQRRNRTTQAAEGLPRWRWTTAELVRLAELGAFTSDDRFELIGGEIVPMSPRGRRHDVIREQLEHALRKRAMDDHRVIAEPQFNLDADVYVYPDLVVYPAQTRAYDVSGSDTLLVVEIAETSLAYDQETKAALYARYGVREYWVVNARTLETTIHRNPGADGYGDVRKVASTEQLTPNLVPSLAVRLADLDLE